MAEEQSKPGILFSLDIISTGHVKEFEGGKAFGIFKMEIAAEVKTYSKIWDDL